MYYKRDLVEKIEEYLGTSKIIVFLDQGKWVKLLDEFKLEVILETVQKVGNGVGNLLSDNQENIYKPRTKVFLD